MVASAARRAALSVTAASAVLIGGLVGLGWVGMTTLAAAAPGLIVAAVLGMYPPPPAKLRTVGWALVATSIVTAVLVDVGSWT